MYVVIYVWLNKRFFRIGPGVCRYLRLALSKRFFRIGSGACRYLRMAKQTVLQNRTGVCRYLHMAKQTVLQNRTWCMSLFTYENVILLDFVIRE